MNVLLVGEESRENGRENGRTRERETSGRRWRVESGVEGGLIIHKGREERWRRDGMERET